MDSGKRVKVYLASSWRKPVMVECEECLGLGFIAAPWWYSILETLLLFIDFPDYPECPNCDGDGEHSPWMEK